MRFKFILLWFAVTVAFEGYGFFQPGAQIHGDRFNVRTALEGAVLFGSLGVGVATCLTMGLVILEKVHRGRMRKASAIASLAGSSVASATATPLIAWLAHDKPPWHILGGEDALAIVDITGWMIVAAGVAFIVFALLTLLTVKVGSREC